MRGCCPDEIIERSIQVRRKQKEEAFYSLMDAVWHGDIQQTVRISARDPSLVNYSRFDFHLELGKKTTSILSYARACGKETIAQILLGFGAKE
jgi:hypothetical protein